MYFPGNQLYELSVPQGYRGITMAGNLKRSASS
jgi:hypothetical protein